MTTRISDFSIEVPAKWILTGEHAVLRGGESVAFVMPKFALKLSYRIQGKSRFTPNPFQSQIKGLLSRALEYLGVREDLFSTGEISISSDIPIGAGLGSSAALCVAIARLAIWKAGSDLSYWIPLATHLEDVFHGKSSGMDVNAIVHGAPILFSMAQGPRPLSGLQRMPRFEFYDSGIRGSTRDCIERVRQWQQVHPHLIEEIDGQMREATRVACEGLERYQSDPNEGEAQIQKAMEMAQGCLETWGLVTPELLGQKYDLLKQGALAVKLTGAGLGGFWIALWPSSGTSTLGT